MVIPDVNLNRQTINSGWVCFASGSQALIVFCLIVIGGKGLTYLCCCCCYYIIVLKEQVFVFKTKCIVNTFYNFNEVVRYRLLNYKT